MKHCKKTYLKLLNITTFTLFIFSCASVPDIVPQNETFEQINPIEENPAVVNEDEITQVVESTPIQVNQDDNTSQSELEEVFATIPENLADIGEPIVLEDEVILAEPVFNPELPEVELPLVVQSTDQTDKTLELSADVMPEDTTESSDSPANMAESLIDEPQQSDTDTQAEVETVISGGIWEDSESYPYIPENSQLIPPPDTTPSRSVSLPVNDALKIEYPGTDWFYLGETEGSELLDFSSRKLDGENTVFTLKAKKDGSAILHFYKQDLLTNDYIDDYLEVSVKKDDNSMSRGEVTAPLYATLVPKKPEEVAQPEQQTEVVVTEEESESIQDSVQTKVIEPSVPVENYQQTIVQTSDTTLADTTVPQENAAEESGNNAKQVADSEVSSNTISSNTFNDEEQSDSGDDARSGTSEQAKLIQEIEESSPAQLLDKAEQAIANLDAASALVFLDAYFSKSAGALDKGWFLRGRAYEAKTNAQDIRAAVDAYQTLMNQFPASRYWQEAKDRATYLNRFYFNIR